MYIVAIDPGPVESGYVVLDSLSFPGEVIAKGKDENPVCMGVLQTWLNGIEKCEVAIEMPACYGMAVGQDVFNTCAVVGHFEELAKIYGTKHTRIYRKKRNPEGAEAVVMALCKNSRAKDSNVRQALIDLYPATGGGKLPQVGTKKAPGPLYGVSKDIWAALGVGITYQMWVTGAACG